MIAYLLNSIAFEHYGDCCDLERLAEEFNRTPGRLKPTLRRLADAGYIEIVSGTSDVIYPTRRLLVEQDPQLTDKEAEQILTKIRRA